MEVIIVSIFSIFKRKLPPKPKIISFDEIYQLTDNDDFHIELREMLLNECDENAQPINMCHTKKVLFLCMMIEDAGQGDTILNFFDEFPDYTNEVGDALFEIGAPKSAEFIKQAIELLPKDGTEFTYATNKKEWDIMMEIGDKFSDYPDGRMRDLYRKYAEKHKNDFL